MLCVLAKFTPIYSQAPSLSHVSGMTSRCPPTPQSCQLQISIHSHGHLSWGVQDQLHVLTWPLSNWVDWFNWNNHSDYSAAHIHVSLLSRTLVPPPKHTPSENTDTNIYLWAWFYFYLIWILVGVIIYFRQQDFFLFWLSPTSFLSTSPTTPRDGGVFLCLLVV